VPSVRARLITAGLIMLMLLGMVAILVVCFGLVMQDFDE
jgi:hypothetical protein